MEISRDSDSYFEYVANYVVNLVSLTLTAELHVAGRASRYEPNHTVEIDGKQTATRLRIYPYALLDELFKLKWPTTLTFEEESISISEDAQLDLGVLELPLFSLEQSMVVSYFERYRADVVVRFGNDTKDWPEDWNFARVVRNSVAHGGTIDIRNANAPPTTWRGLSYGPAENGRRVIHNDLWPADLILLLRDLDGHIAGSV